MPPATSCSASAQNAVARHAVKAYAIQTCAGTIRSANAKLKKMKTVTESLAKVNAAASKIDDAVDDLKKKWDQLKPLVGSTPKVGKIVKVTVDTQLETVGSVTGAIKSATKVLEDLDEAAGTAVEYGTTAADGAAAFAAATRDVHVALDKGLRCGGAACAGGLRGRRGVVGDAAAKAIAFYDRVVPFSACESLTDANHRVDTWERKISAQIAALLEPLEKLEADIKRTVKGIQELLDESLSTANQILCCTGTHHVLSFVGATVDLLTCPVDGVVNAGMAKLADVAQKAMFELLQPLLDSLDTVNLPTIPAIQMKFDVAELWDALPAEARGCGLPERLALLSTDVGFPGLDLKESLEDAFRLELPTGKRIDELIADTCKDAVNAFSDISCYCPTPKWLSLEKMQQFKCKMMANQNPLARRGAGCPLFDEERDHFNAMRAAHLAKRCEDRGQGSRCGAKCAHNHYCQPDGSCGTNAAPTC
jgi:prefoldin subunit 5